MDFRQFFESLSARKQQAFADAAGYSLANIALHFACEPSRRRKPSGPGFARLVVACRRYERAPSQASLFAYFYEPNRRPRRRTTERAAA